MIPVLATATGLDSTKTKALEHGTLLLERVVVTFTSAESIAEVVVVLVIHIRLLGVNTPAGVGLFICAQRAGARRRNALRATIACEVALLENLDEGVLAMALNGACVANTGRSPFIAELCRRRIAGQARKNILSQRTLNLSAAFDALR